MKAIHTEFRKGQKIFIILRSGEKLVEKYIEKNQIIFFVRTINTE